MRKGRAYILPWAQRGGDDLDIGHLLPYEHQIHYGIALRIAAQHNQAAGVGGVTRTWACLRPDLVQCGCVAYAEAGSGSSGERKERSKNVNPLDPFGSESDLAEGRKKEGGMEMGL